ncbi:MAG: efflux RND transporter permease subunit, partial [Cytophagales bacterium]|nr:efflux RND transporter permease subunit [Cytophagales bacterium]
PADQYALMGVLILIGVVVNNGIILLDYARQLESEGFRKSRAIIQSGITRIRPVLITAATTVAALVPIALGEEQYMGAISQPFALTVIGGLTFSTLLTLILIPAFYSGMQSAIRWMRGLSPWAKTFQLFVLAGLYSMLYITLNSLIWQILWGTLGTMAVPALTYFLTESLKKASADVIPRGEPIHITIRHLSKVYGRPNQVKREWMAVQRIQRTLGLDGEYHSGYDRLKLLWQVPLMAFWAYLTFYYTKNPLWNFVFVILFNVLAVQFFKPLLFSFLNKKQIELLKKASYWVLPAVNMVYFFLSWESIGTAVVLLLALLVLLVGFDQNRRVEQKKKQWEKMNFVFRILGKFAKWIKSRWYPEEFRALKAVDLDIGQGMFGLLGPNGAGKSTLMRVICGILEQSYGKIWINGLDTQEKREELQGLIGFLPQEFGMYEKMSPASYLDYQAILKGLTDSEVRKERLRYVLESVHLYDRRHEPIGSFSGGMKQRVGIAQTLLHLPRILVVDEPTAGLDPKERIRFRNLLVELSSERVVIFSTHILEDVASACNRLAILKRGEIQFRGTPQSMTKVASGKVWEMTIAGDELDAWNENLIVTHHMQEDDGLRVRCLSPEAPTATAVPLPPNLEDAYLWLLKGKSMFEEKKQEYANA